VLLKNRINTNLNPNSNLNLNKLKKTILKNKMFAVCFKSITMWVCGMNPTIKPRKLR